MKTLLGMARTTKHLTGVGALAVAWLLGGTPPAAADGGCQFVLGFATVANLIPEAVGSCIDNESHNPENGDGLQHTSTGGLMAWRKADNWTAFTDGYSSWINGPNGLQQRLNTQRFIWEANPEGLPAAEGTAPAGPQLPPRPTPAPAPWPADKSLAITVLAPDGDPRIQLAQDAVEFWNGQFAEIGLPVRLGPVGRATLVLPTDYVQAIGAIADSGNLRYASSGLSTASGTLPPPPEAVLSVPGDIIVAMSDADFVSFGGVPLKAGVKLVGIKSYRLSPLTLPNVARNVIAHEMGHALGLNHNDDPSMLMCGRPAPCRPDAFRSSTDRYFPLTDQEKARLKELYPPNWRRR